MSSSPNCHTGLESPHNDFFRYFRCCMQWLPCLQSRRQVHPSAGNLIENKFIILSSQKLIRVIHMDYDSKIPPNRDSLTGIVGQPPTTNSRNNSKTLSSDTDCNDYKRRTHSMISNTSEQSEDYWFTHWSRPPKPTDTCNCSFRTSWRSSLRDSRFSDIQNALSEVKECFYTSQEGTNTQVNQPTTIHNFADNLVEKILVEVIDHLTTGDSKNNITAKSNGTINVHSTLHKEELNCSTKDLNVSSNGCVYSGNGVLNPSFIDHPSDPVVAAYNDIIGLENISYKVNRSEELQPNFSSLHKSAKNICEAKNSSIESPEFKTADAEKSLSTINEKTTEHTNYHTRKIEKPLVEEPHVVTRAAHSKCHQKCTHSKNNKRLKPPIYFLHGAGSSADIWLRVMKHFAKAGFEVVAPDMLGHGYSSAPDSPALYSFSSILKDTVEIFDKFINEQQKCVVIGHAYGCSLAVALSRCRPQQVIQLVLISGGGPTPLAPHTVDCRPVANSPCVMMCLQPLLKCGFRRNVLYSTYGKHMVACDAAGSGVPQYVLDYLAQGQDWPEGDAAFHRRITIPTLLVHGMQDPLVPLVHECEMERTIPRSFLEVIPNAGHFAMLETPEKLIHMIRCFIDWWNA